MRAVAIDDGNFKIDVGRGGGDVLPFRLDPRDVPHGGGTG